VKHYLIKPKVKLKNIASRISNKLNRTLTDYIFAAKLEQLIFSKKKGAVILTYHGIDLNEDKRFNMHFFRTLHLKSICTILKNI